MTCRRGMFCPTDAGELFPICCVLFLCVIMALEGMIARAGSIVPLARVALLGEMARGMDMLLMVTGRMVRLVTP